MTLETSTTDRRIDTPDAREELASLLEVLRVRYREEKLPLCRVCAAPLVVVREGGGEPTLWACGTITTDELTNSHGAQRHYAASYYQQTREGDNDVLALVTFVENAIMNDVPINA